MPTHAVTHAVTHAQALGPGCTRQHIADLSARLRTPMPPSRNGPLSCHGLPLPPALQPPVLSRDWPSPVKRLTGSHPPVLSLGIAAPCRTALQVLCCTHYTLPTAATGTASGSSTPLFTAVTPHTPR
jgi:hypothetical protein